MTRENIWPWIISSVLFFITLGANFKLIQTLEKAGEYKGKYEVLREIKDIYMPAPNTPYSIHEDINE